MTELLMLFVGLAVGSVTAWLILKSRIQQAANAAKTAAQSEIAVLTERLQGRETQIQVLTTSVKTLSDDNSRLQGELTSASAKLAAAEEKNSQIPALNGSLAAGSRPPGSGTRGRWNSRRTAAFSFVTLPQRNRT